MQGADPRRFGLKKALAASVVLFALAGLMVAQDMKKDTSGGAPSSSGSMMSATAATADPAKAVFDLTGLGPGIVPFSGEAGAQRMALDRRTVYFFAASWCPTCNATYKDFKANFAKVPKDLVIVVVDYDKAAALKTKYGVTYQHTYVAIGPKGEKLKTWSGSMSVAEIAKNVPKR